MNKTHQIIGIFLPNKKIRNEAWFADLLYDVSLPTTQFIEKKFPGIKFVLLEQKISNSHVLRTIGFFVGDHLICKATNRAEKNEVANKWIKENPDEPFGKVFQSNKLDRVLISKTSNSRKYRVTGDIHAVIEEKFYLLP